MGEPFRRAACLGKSGGFKLGSLPAGKYSVFVRHHSPGLEKGQYLTKGGKRTYFAVTSGKTTSTGSRALPAKRAMVRGTITLPKVPHVQCVVSLTDPRGKNRSAGFHTSTKVTSTSTKVSYRVWAKSGGKAKFKVRYTCYNEDWYTSRWGFTPDFSLAVHPTWYSGGGTSVSNARTVLASASKPGKLNVTSRRAAVGTPQVTGTAKVGQTLRVKVPKLGKSARYVVRWVVNGKVFDANPCGPVGERDCYLHDKRAFRVTGKHKGASIKAQLLVAQDKRWTVMKTTKAVKVH